ncbi:hypothetical protein D9M71_357150 [compost metagenome]
MPPFHSRSTGALSRALISSVGVSFSAWMSKRSRTSGLSAMLLAARGNTPPPAEISEVS